MKIWKLAKDEYQKLDVSSGALRIRRDWDGTYHVEQYCHDLAASFAFRRMIMTWRDVAGGFATQQDAEDRIKFMGMVDMLVTSSTDGSSDDR